MTVSSTQELEEDLEFLSAKLAEPKEKREKWLNGIVDKWISRRRAKTVVTKKGRKSSTKRK